MRLIYKISDLKLSSSTDYLNFIDNSQMIQLVDWGMSYRDIYYYLDGRFHREGGPAVEYASEWGVGRYYEYWLHGKRYKKMKDYNNASRFSVTRSKFSYHKGSVFWRKRCD